MDPLHIGMEHPELTWLFGASAVTFAAGLAIGLLSDRLRTWLGIEDAPAGS